MVPRPFHIHILNPKDTYASGDVIRGMVGARVPWSSVESAKISLIGTTETLVNHRRCRRHQLIDIEKPLIPVPDYGGYRAFEFTIPILTDTPGKHGRTTTPRKFAVQRHRLPPTFSHRDSRGNTATVDYAICARMTFTDPNETPHVESIDLTITHKPHSPTNYNSPQVELISLSVTLKEETSILGPADGRHSIHAWFGCFHTHKDIKELAVEDRRAETWAPTMFKNEGTQSVLGMLFTVPVAVRQKTQTFNLYRRHSVTVKADLAASQVLAVVSSSFAGSITFAASVDSVDSVVCHVVCRTAKPSDSAVYPVVIATSVSGTGRCSVPVLWSGHLVLVSA
ncbi:uncharacterized protein BKCO1_4000118 [Diplodia corticola]|uniref:Uncharacterized protein n=1 Tax=Diplodia corticola TaxID=236234 RepID=A0A1J9SGE2_9PEZI|nr:uncharacterized protein BKCO1_4000118 [Diplodia corticola]OJD38653.1 hypothetical protein BKCO1_4000118 [Diplodia corticola]